MIARTQHVPQGEAEQRSTSHVKCLHQLTDAFSSPLLQLVDLERNFQSLQQVSPMTG